MKKIIINNIIQLLLLVAVIGGLLWLLPVKVTVGILFMLQLLTLVIIGNILKQRDNGGKEE